MTKSKPLVFFGSGPVAALTLKSIALNLSLSAVVTKPANKHGHRSTPPVEKLAKQLDLPILFTSSKEDLTKITDDKIIESFCGLVVDYGLIIPSSVIDYFEMGIINSHFSLLPLWRGADPITFPILTGDKKTGVSLMVINDAMDEGDLIAQEELSITADDTSVSLTVKLIGLNDAMLNSTLPRYFAHKIKPWPQNPKIQPTYSRKLAKNDGKIDWNKSATVLEREIRAYNVWPKSFGTIGSIEVIVVKATVIDKTGTTGKVFKDDSNLGVYCGKQALIIDTLKVSGKSEMTGADFLNGYGQSIL